MRRLRLRDEGGVTLIEMMKVLAILGTMLGGATSVFVAGSRSELQVNASGRRRRRALLPAPCFSAPIS